MAISRLVSLPEIAALLETDLNNYSLILFSDGKIDSEIKFKVSANFDDYQNGITTKNTAGDDVLYTPCIINKLSSSVIPDPDLEAYVETYSFDLMGYQDDIDDLRTIFDSYALNARGKHTTYGSWIIQELIEPADFAGNIDLEDGSAVDRVYGTLSMTWSFLDGGIHSSQVSIKVADVVERVPLELESAKIYMIATLGDTDFTNFGASTNTVGTIFEAADLVGDELNTTGTCFEMVSIPISSYTISTNKSALSGVFNNTTEMASIMQSVGYGISISLTYLKSNDIIVRMAKDALDPSGEYLNNNYKIYYDDGVIQQLYSTVMTSGTLAYGPGDVLGLTLSFSPFKEGVL